MDEGESQIEEMDEQRARYIRRHYGVDWDDPELYHLVINTGDTGEQVAGCIVLQAARCLFGEMPEQPNTQGRTR